MAAISVEENNEMITMGIGEWLITWLKVTSQKKVGVGELGRRGGWEDGMQAQTMSLKYLLQKQSEEKPENITSCFSANLKQNQQISSVWDDFLE